MRTLPTLAVLAAGLLPALFAQPVSAAERQPFEVVKGWEVERTVGDTSANPCIMTHAYEDKDDNNAANAVVFALRDSTAVMQGLALVSPTVRLRPRESASSSLSCCVLTYAEASPPAPRRKRDAAGDFRDVGVPRATKES